MPRTKQHKPSLLATSENQVGWLDVVRDETGRELEGPYKHLHVLERRLKFLQGRIERGKQDGRNLSHDEHEADALEWAVGAIYQHVPLPEKE